MTNEKTSSFFDEDMLAKEPRDSTIKADTSSQSPKETSNKKIISSLVGKEVLDRIGYGFGAQQFIIILFFLTGAGPLLVGLLNGLKDVLSSILSSFLAELTRFKTFSKQYVATAGIIFGFSLIGILLALRMEQVWLYAVALFIGNIAIVVYGELHGHITTTRFSFSRRHPVLRWLSTNGLFITAVSFLCSGLLLELFWNTSSTINLLGFSLPVSGAFLTFEIAAIAFILSGFMLRRLPLREQQHNEHKQWDVFKHHVHSAFHNLRFFFKQRYLSFMMIGSVLITVIQSLGASFYGYYIYEYFKTDVFGGFINVAIVFVVALLFSLIGPRIIQFLHKHISLGPLFVFGTLLSAMLPLVLLYNPLFPAVLVAVTLTIIGYSILSTAQSLLAQQLLGNSERESFFNITGFVSALPFLVLVIAGSILAMSSYLLLFKAIIFTLIGILTPFYILLVLISREQRI